ncbi:glycoside hydrolase family 13 protein [Gallaecimonas sp. GXIMD1310]|uniref:glycoside hydrolase family 13 protein n=1 Tax=Gallaecimonas sp. GXIMD1310 TaxID=3131926 RepID=UPI0032439216
MRIMLMMLALFISTGASAFSLDHIEPGNWWVGMKRPSVQLMVYGKGIGHAEVSMTPYPGVTLQSSTRVASPDYLFVTLRIQPAAKPGRVQLHFRQGQQQQVLAYPLWQRRQGSAARQGFSAKDVIYLITPDRFANGDPGNDNVPGYGDKANRANPGGRHGGDLQGVIDHLDYLQKLGVTQLWLNPVVENAVPSYSYHGYSATNFYRVDPRFGSNQLYRELSAKARAHGMGLIIDVVLNHIGAEHPWMKDLPTPDWLNGQHFHPTNHRRETLHDPHGAKVDQQQFNDGWFVPSMPDLNQRNPLVATYLIQNSIWWVEYANLSGIRIDTYSYSDRTFLGQWSQALMREYPHLNMVGEEWSTDPAIVSYWQKGNHPKDGYVSNLPSLMDFPLQAAIAPALTARETWKSGITGLYQVLADDFLYAHPNKLVVFADNHDTNRIMTQLHDDPALWKMAIALVLTTRGIPQIFYGTELMMANPGGKNDGVIRSDFPGGWPGDKVNAFSGKGLSAAQRASQQYLRTLLQYRQHSAALTSGRLLQYVPEQGSYVYFRISPGQRVMVVLNKTDKVLTLSTKRFREGLVHFHHGRDVISGQIFDLRQSLTLPAKTARILELLP